MDYYPTVYTNGGRVYNMRSLIVVTHYVPRREAMVLWRVTATTNNVTVVAVYTIRY